MLSHRITRSAALGLTLAAFAAPTAAAVPADLRSPDTRDAAITAAASGGPRDMRSPDTRDAALTAEAAKSAPRQDMRSPDTQDYAAGRGTFNAPDVTVVKVSEPSPVAGGLDWADAGIGAGGMLGLVLVGVGGALMISRRTHRPAHGRTAITG